MSTAQEQEELADLYEGLLAVVKDVCSMGISNPKSFIARLAVIRDDVIRLRQSQELTIPDTQTATPTHDYSSHVTTRTGWTLGIVVGGAA